MVGPEGCGVLRTAQRYRQQLLQLSRSLKEKKRSEYAVRHDKVILQHDNARPHAAKVVKDTLEDIAPSDYHLFRSMAHDLADQHFTSYEETKNWVDLWLSGKNEEFYRRGIRELPERWEKVVACDGRYFQ